MKKANCNSEGSEMAEENSCLVAGEHSMCSHDCPQGTKILLLKKIKSVCEWKDILGEWVSLWEFFSNCFYEWRTKESMLNVESKWCEIVAWEWKSELTKKLVVLRSYLKFMVVTLNKTRQRTETSEIMCKIVYRSISALKSYWVGDQMWENILKYRISLLGNLTWITCTSLAKSF